MFIDLLQRLNRGSGIVELDESLRLIAEAVKSTGKSGKLKLEITIKPSDRGNTETMIFHDKIVAEIPTPDRSPAVMFWDEEERKLVRQPPRQKDTLFGDIRQEQED